MATIPIVDDIHCYQSHATFYDNFLTNSTLCAGNPRGNGDFVTISYSYVIPNFFF